MHCPPWPYQTDSSSNFRFRSPVYRFLDLCHEVLAEAGTGEEEKAP